MIEELRKWFDFTPELETFLTSYPGPIHVRAYEVFPDLNDLTRWREEDPDWPAHWWPLSSKFHLVHFFWDLQDGHVGMLPSFKETDEEGGYTNAKRVYDTLEDFRRVVRVNADELTKPNAFSLEIDDSGFIKEEVEVLSDASAQKISDAISDVNGPKILPFFHGTLGAHDALASPESYQPLAW